MKLTVLGSGSSANGYVLQNDTEAIILECGCPVQDALRAIDYNTRKVAAVFVTHEHGDHAKYISDYLKYFRVFCSQGTLSACAFYKDNLRPTAIKQLKHTYQYGTFSVMAFDVQHDAEEPVGYIIRHNEIGTMLFATDTYYIKYTFNKWNLTNIMIECNYDLPILMENVEKGIVHKRLEERILESHMSLEHLKDLLKANDISQVCNIVLIHLSANNADPATCQREIELLTGKKVHIAKKGLSIPFNTTPF